ncbi:hypothetical protein FISHEDRAFT_56984 [Fistulina hepatica ATCC 64428]|nr:hypothetical protein FISHEDRAFT_56984 [Fistulina hepatica ATCC 64428]
MMWAPCAPKDIDRRPRRAHIRMPEAAHGDLHHRGTKDSVVSPRAHLHTLVEAGWVLSLNWTTWREYSEGPTRTILAIPWRESFRDRARCWHADSRSLAYLMPRIRALAKRVGKRTKKIVEAASRHRNTESEVRQDNPTSSSTNVITTGTVSTEGVHADEDMRENNAVRDAENAASTATVQTTTTTTVKLELVESFSTRLPDINTTSAGGSSITVKHEPKDIKPILRDKRPVVARRPQRIPPGWVSRPAPLTRNGKVAYQVPETPRHRSPPRYQPHELRPTFAQWDLRAPPRLPPIPDGALVLPSSVYAGIDDYDELLHFYHSPPQSVLRMAERDLSPDGPDRLRNQEELRREDEFHTELHRLVEGEWHRFAEERPRGLPEMSPQERGHLILACEQLIQEQQSRYESENGLLVDDPLDEERLVTADEMRAIVRATIFSVYRSPSPEPAPPPTAGGLAFPVQPPPRTRTYSKLRDAAAAAGRGDILGRRKKGWLDVLVQLLDHRRREQLVQREHDYTITDNIHTISRTVDDIVGQAAGLPSAVRRSGSAPADIGRCVNSANTGRRPEEPSFLSLARRLPQDPRYQRPWLHDTQQDSSMSSLVVEPPSILRARRPGEIDLGNGYSYIHNPHEEYDIFTEMRALDQKIVDGVEFARERGLGGFEHIDEPAPSDWWAWKRASGEPDPRLSHMARPTASSSKDATGRDRAAEAGPSSRKRPRAADDEDEEDRDDAPKRFKYGQNFTRECHTVTVCDYDSLSESSSRPGSPVVPFVMRDTEGGDAASGPSSSAIAPLPSRSTDDPEASRHAGPSHEVPAASTVPAVPTVPAASSVPAVSTEPAASTVPAVSTEPAVFAVSTHPSELSTRKRSREPSDDPEDMKPEKRVRFSD